MIILGYYYGVGGPSCTRIMQHSRYTKYAMSWGSRERTSYYQPAHPQARKSGRVFVRTIIRWNDEPVLFFRHGYSGTQIEDDWVDIVSPFAMRIAQNKYRCRGALAKKDVSVPVSWQKHDRAPFLPCVGRPMNHSQGRDFNVYRSVAEYEASNDGYYAQLINKSAEYRVYVYGGYAYAVSQKNPESGVRADQPWNHSQGNAQFKIMRNQHWPKGAVKEALKASYALQLFYCAVDVMVDEDGQPFICEVNTAGSLKGKLKPSHVGYLLDRTYVEYVGGNTDVLNIVSPDDRKKMRHPWLKEKEDWYEAR